MGLYDGRISSSSKGSSGVGFGFWANGKNDERRVDRDVGFSGDASM